MISMKPLLGALVALLCSTAFAGVDVNKASQAELESVPGIGPAASGRIVDERQKAPFKDWPDLVGRIKGVGNGNAAKFSSAGLTVNGAAFAAAGDAPTAAKPARKPAASLPAEKQPSGK